MNEEVCDICGEEKATYIVFCEHCKEKHNLCSMCFDNGHIERKGKDWTNERGSL